MWFTLDPASISEGISLFTENSNSNKNASSVIFDLPSNMEVIKHPHDVIQIKFFYYAGGSENQSTMTLRTSVSEVGAVSKRLFSISSRDIESLKEGIRELILGCAKPRTELNLKTCLKAIEINENSFKPKPNNDIIKMSQGQKFETLLSTVDIDTIETIQGILEAASNLKFSNIEQVMIILDMYLNNHK